MVTPQQAGQTGEDVAAYSDNAGISSFTLRDILIVAFFHIRVVAVAALLPLIIAIAAALTAKTEYTANSLLMVIVSREVANTQNVTDSGPAVLSIEGLKQVETEVQILESADVARATIEQIGVDRLYPAGPFSALWNLFDSNQDRMYRAIERFQRNLRASVLSGSNVIQVSFTNPDREVAIEATDALIRNYLANRRKVLENPMAKILMLEVDRFRGELERTDQEIEALKTKAGIIEFSQDAALAANQVDGVLQRRRQLAEREVAVTAQLAEAERQLKAMPDSVFDFSEKTDAVSGDEASNLLTKLLMDRERLSAQYAPGSPFLRDVNRQIETVRKRIAARQSDPYFTDRAVRNPSITYVQNMILNLKVELDAISRQKDELVQQQRLAEERVAKLRTAETRLVELNRQRDTQNDGFREYLRRAVAANIEETAARSRESNVRVVQEAGSAVTKRSLVFPLLAAGLFAGLLFGAAAGAVASVVRTSFILPSEAEHALKLPSLAAFESGAEADFTPGVEQALSNCATLLIDTRVDDEPVRTMHFLSSEPDDTLVWFCRSLAEEFAKQHKKRTLLVDLVSATPYPIQSATPEIVGGLAVTATPVPSLWSAADTEASPLLSLRLPVADGMKMMDELKAHYDYVVFCSSLQSTSLLALRLSQLVDGNVLAIHAEQTRKAAASHLRNSVAESGGALLGLVFLGRNYYLPDWLYRRA